MPCDGIRFVSITGRIIMGEMGWGIVFVLVIAGFVTVILTTVIWQLFQIAKIKTRMSFDADRTAVDQLSHQPATAEH